MTVTVTTIYGSSSSDTIIPGSGAYAGQDPNAGYAIYGEGNDTSTALLQDPTGNDVITAGNGNNQLYDGIGNSTITSGGGNNYMIVGGGKNQLTVGNGMNSIFGGAGNDTITAGSGYNQINGGSGGSLITTSDAAAASSSTISNYIYGGIGNDTIHVGNGNDIIFANVPIGTAVSGVAWHANTAPNIVTAGNGNNQIATGEGGSNVTVGNGSNYIVGGGGNDNITVGGSATALNVVLGYGGNDNITATGQQNGSYFNGGVGNDTITVTSGNSAMDGGGGNDSLHGGTGNDTMYGDIGSSTMVGGTHTDLFYVYYPDTVGGTGVHVTYTGAGAGTVTKPAADGGTDQFTNINYIVGSMGNDTLDASKNTVGTYLDGQSGKDLLIGGSGNDTLLASSGTDTISITGNGSDLIDGGSSGKSVLSYTNYTGGITLTLGAPDTGTVTKTGSATDNFGHISNITTNAHATVTGASGGGFAVTSGGSNLFNAGQYAAGATVGDTLIGGGNDTLNYTGATGNISVDLNQGIAVIGALTETLQNFNNGANLVTGNGNDSIHAGSNGNTFTVGTGSNLIMVNGATGTGDTVNATAGTGVDTINTGAGSNLINTNGHSLVYFTDANTGHDTLNDGAGGHDTVSFAYAPKVALTLSDASGSATVGGSHALSITSDQNANYTLSATGNDTATLTGTHSYSIGSGGSGNDSFNATANSGNDSLHGGAGADTILGGTGGDYLYSGIGNDSLVGNANTTVGTTFFAGGGHDTMIGGGISNDFHAAQNDVVTGLAGASNTLDLSGLSSASTLNFSQGSVSQSGTGAGASAGSTYTNITTVITSAVGGDVFTGNAVSLGETIMTGINPDGTLATGVINGVIVDINGNHDTINSGGEDAISFALNPVNSPVNLNFSTNTFTGGNTTGLQVNGHLYEVWGSNGNDTINGSNNVFNVAGGAGNDSLSSNSTVINVIYGGPGHDTIVGSASHGTWIVPGSGAESINGNGGFLEYLNSPAAVDVNLSTGLSSGGNAAGDTITPNSIGYIWGTAFADTLTGNTNGNTIFHDGPGGGSITGLGFNNGITFGSGGVTANLATDKVSGGSDTTDTITGSFNAIYGSRLGDNNMTLGDVSHGGGAIYSLGANDTMTGGTGGAVSNFVLGSPGAGSLFNGGANAVMNFTHSGAGAYNVADYYYDPNLTSLGNDVINSFVHGTDFIEFNHTVIPSISSLSITVSGNNSIIHFGSATVTVVGDNNLQASDFFFA